VAGALTTRLPPFGRGRLDRRENLVAEYLFPMFRFVAKRRLVRIGCMVFAFPENPVIIGCYAFFDLSLVYIFEKADRACGKNVNLITLVTWLN